MMSSKSSKQDPKSSDDAPKAVISNSVIDQMRESFNNIYTTMGENLTAENIINWFKSADLIDAAKITEEKVKALYESSEGDFEKFQTGLQKLSEDTEVSMDEMQKKLSGASEEHVRGLKGVMINALESVHESVGTAIDALKKK